MSKLLKIMAISTGVLLLLCLAVVVFFTSSPGEDLMRGWLANRLSSEVGLPVTIDRLESNLWSRLQMDTLVVMPAADSGGTPVLFIGRLTVGYTFPDLLGNTIRLRSVAVDSIALALEIDSLGGFGIPIVDSPTPEDEKASEPGGAFVVDSVVVDRIGVSLLDSRLPLHIGVSGAAIALQGVGDETGTGRVSVSGVSANWDSLALDARDLNLAGSLSDDRLRIDHAGADLEGLQLEVTGEVGISSPRSLAVTLTAEGNLSTLASRLAAAYKGLKVSDGYANLECIIEGTTDAPQVSVEGSLRDLTLPESKIDSASVLARYADSTIELEDVSISAFGGMIRGAGKAAPDLAGAAELQITLDGISLDEIWQAVYGETSPYQGSLDGAVNVEGRGRNWDSWSVDASLSGKNLRYDNREIPDLLCEVRHRSDRTVLSVLHGSNEITADVELSADSVSGTFSVSAPELTDLARFADQPELSGAIQAEGTVDGAYADPRIGLTLSGSKISYRNFPVDTLAVELVYSESLLNIIDLSCMGSLDSLGGSEPPFDLDSLHGALIYECRLSGVLDELRGGLSLSLTAPGYKQYSLDSLVAEAALDGSRLRLTRLEVSHHGIAAVAQAVFDTTTGDGSFELTMRPGAGLSDVDTEKDQAREAIPARDSLGSVTGDFNMSPDSELRATVRAERMWLGLISTLTGDSLQLDGEADFDLSVDGPILTPAASLNTTIRSLEVSGYGMDSIVARIDLNRDALVLDSLTAYEHGQQLRASGRLDLSVTDDGYYDLAPDGAVKMELETTGFDVSALSGLVFSQGQLAGTLSAALRVSGQLSSPTCDGRLTLHDGRVMMADDSTAVENVALSLSFADTTLTIDSVAATVSGLPLRASGSLATSQFQTAFVDLGMSVGTLGRLEIKGSVSDERVDLNLLSDTLNLALFQPFITDIDSLRGRLNTQMDIRGELSALEVDGTMGVSDLSLHSAQQGLSIADGYAGLRFNRSQVLIDALQATLNGGKIKASGTVTHDQGKLVDIDLNAYARHVTLKEPGVYTVDIDSAVLSYERRNDAYVLSGDVVLGEARLTAGVRPASVLPWVQSIETVDMELPELVARSRLDLRIRESNNLWVDNNLARIRLRAEIGIIGTPLRPNFTGLVRIEEGYLLYLDRRFQITEGTVYFTDPTRLNPDINLEASTQVTVYRRTAPEPYTVFIRAEGPLNQLRYGLYSEPELDRPDIVALLTLGATRSDLTKGGDSQGEGGLTQVLKDRAAMLTSQRVSGYLSRRAGTLFGFDEFTIQGNLFQFGDSWGPELVASKRLSRNLNLTYSTTVGHLNDQTVRLGYRLTPRWSLIGETDRQGRSGLDLKYGITFK